MTLATHTAIAAAVTKSFAQTHPTLGFFAAIASHYLSDAIPHWDYRLHAENGMAEKTKEEWSRDDARMFRRRIVRDMRAIAMDGCVGTLLVILFVRPASHGEWLWIAGAVAGGILPDFLQGLYLSGLRFLKPIQRFHDVMHAKIRLGPYPVIGIPFQLSILLVSLYFLA